MGAEDYIKAVTWENFDELKKPEIFASSKYFEMGFTKARYKMANNRSLMILIIIGCESTVVSNAANCTGWLGCLKWVKSRTVL